MFPKMIATFSTSSNGDSPFGSKQKFLKENPDDENSDDCWLLSYILNLQCLSVCPGSFQALPGPLFFCFFFFFFNFFYGFCFLWQLLLDGCIMHQVHTSILKAQSWTLTR